MWICLPSPQIGNWFFYFSSSLRAQRRSKKGRLQAYAFFLTIHCETGAK